MRLRCKYRSKKAEENIIKRISGNTVDPEAAWCLTSVPVVDGMGRNSFWDGLKAFCRPTDMQLTIRLGERSWFMLHAGRTWKGTLLRSCSSIPRMQSLRRLWIGSMSCLPSMLMPGNED